MRRVDRDYTDTPGIPERVVAEAEVLHIALPVEGGVPYIVPLCFGHEKRKDGGWTFWFHKAGAGRANDIIGSSCVCGFSLETGCSLFMDDAKRTCNMDYGSMVGEGVVSLVTDEEERLRGIRLLMEHYGRAGYPVEMRSMPVIKVYRLDTTRVSVKATKGWAGKGRSEADAD